MNSNFKAKLFQNLSNKKANKGFTLIELLVVVIIIGVLAAIALPNLMSQVAKGRQAEAKTNLGALNRAQQAYRLEQSRFSPTINPSGANVGLDVRAVGEFYDYPSDLTSAGTVNAQQVQMLATAKESYWNDIKDYRSGVFQAPVVNTQRAIICEATAPTGNNTNGTTQLTPTIDNTGITVACLNNNVEIK